MSALRRLALAFLVLAAPAASQDLGALQASPVANADLTKRFRSTDSDKGLPSPPASAEPSLAFWRTPLTTANGGLHQLRRGASRGEEAAAASRSLLEQTRQTPRRRRGSDLTGAMKNTYDSNKCLEYRYELLNSPSKSVDLRSLLTMNNCHTGSSQKWYRDGVRLRMPYIDQCLEHHTSQNYLFMAECHGGDTQQFYWDGDTGRLRNYVFSAKCVTQLMSNYVRMSVCYDNDDRQKWYNTNQDCEVSWYDWGNCSKSCGSGTQSRKLASKSADQMGEGDPCPSSPETRSCNTQACAKGRKRIQECNNTRLCPGSLKHTVLRKDSHVSLKKAKARARSHVVDSN